MKLLKKSACTHIKWRAARDYRAYNVYPEEIMASCASRWRAEEQFIYAEESSNGPGVIRYLLAVAVR